MCRQSWLQCVSSRRNEGYKHVQDTYPRMGTWFLPFDDYKVLVMVFILSKQLRPRKVREFANSHSYFKPNQPG